jgi:hypothetical protein
LGSYIVQLLISCKNRLGIGFGQHVLAIGVHTFDVVRTGSELCAFAAFAAHSDNFCAFGDVVERGQIVAPSHITTTQQRYFCF